MEAAESHTERFCLTHSLQLVNAREFLKRQFFYEALDGLHTALQTKGGNFRSLAQPTLYA